MFERQPLIHKVSKLFIMFVITTSTTYAMDLFGYGGRDHENGNNRESTVKTITNLRTGEKITSISDPKHEQGAASLAHQYGSGGNHKEHQDGSYLKLLGKPAVIIPMQGFHHNDGVTSMQDSENFLLYPYQGFPQMNSQSTRSRGAQQRATPSAPLLPPPPFVPSATLKKSDREDSPLLATAVYTTYLSTMDIEGNCQHDSIGRNCTDSLARIFSVLCCMNTVKIVSFSVVVACLFTGSGFLLVQGSAMMVHAAPNAKQVPYITHADDDKVVYADDVQNEYFDDDYVKMINGDPYHVNNHHHLVPVHTKLKHIINNHFHEVTRYRCEGSACSEYDKGESIYALGFVGVVATSVGALLLIMNACFVGTYYPS